ncbi:MAG: hypothetical protein WC962_08580, partial [Phycisphaerae bacterium]
RRAGEAALLRTEILATVIRDRAEKFAHSEFSVVSNCQILPSTFGAFLRKLKTIFIPSGETLSRYIVKFKNYFSALCK